MMEQTNAEMPNFAIIWTAGDGLRFGLEDKNASDWQSGIWRVSLLPVATIRNEK